MDIIKEAMADVWPHAVYIHFLMKTIANFCFSSQNPWDQKKVLNGQTHSDDAVWNPI